MILLLFQQQTRGCSVPDYMFCPLNDLSYCTEMKTILVRDLFNQLLIPPPQSLPDHSILSGTFMTSSYSFSQSDQSSLSLSTICRSLLIKNKRKIWRKLMKVFSWAMKHISSFWIQFLDWKTQKKNQNEINALWLEIKTLFLNEMAALPDIPSANCKKLNKRKRKGHKFWNNELANLWFGACQAEKQYL